MDTLRDPHTMPTLAGPHAHYRTCLDEDRCRPQRDIDRHLLMCLVRNNILPPSEPAANGDDQANYAEDVMRDQPSDEERKAERKNHGPERRRRHENVRLPGSLAGFSVIESMFHLPTFR